jgi:DNA polymerase III delta subunit
MNIPNPPFQSKETEDIDMYDDFETKSANKELDKLVAQNKEVASIFFSVLKSEGGKRFVSYLEGLCQKKPMTVQFEFNCGYMTAIQDLLKMFHLAKLGDI